MPKKKGAGKRKIVETPEEKAMRLEMEALKAVEEAKYRADMMRHKLETRMQEEAEFSRLNTSKIQHQWRKMMRMAKVEQLRHDLEIMSQNHEREVDMKDAIIQMLDRDLDEAEEQYQTALRSHLRNMDALLALFESKMAQLRAEFETELTTLVEDFSAERKELLTKHVAKTQEFQDILEMQAEQFQASEEDQRQDFESHCQEIKNKNMEDLNMLRLTLEGAIEDLEKHFISAADSYSSQTRDKVQKFRDFTDRDREAALTIEKQLKRLQRLQDNLSLWRTKITANTQESDLRNGMLRKEKQSLQGHFNATKSAMNKVRDDQAQLLKALSVQARHCETSLDEQLQQGANLLSLGELNRKLESGREKIAPFYPFLKVSKEEEDAMAKVPAALKHETNALSSYARTQAGEVVEQWSVLDNFFRKYNMVVLDKEAIKTEQRRLQEENVDLRSILKQYLDGISVNRQVLEGPNPLLVVNQRSAIQSLPPAVATSAPTTVIDGAMALTNQHYQPRQAL